MTFRVVRLFLLSVIIAAAFFIPVRSFADTVIINGNGNSNTPQIRVVERGKSKFFADRQAATQYRFRNGYGTYPGRISLRDREDTRTSSTVTGADGREYRIIKDVSYTDDRAIIKTITVDPNGERTVKKDKIDLN